MHSQPITVTGGPDQPFFVRGHQLPVNRADLAPLVYENERTIEAVPAAIDGALNASQIDGHAMGGRGRAEWVEMSGLGLNSLSCTGRNSMRSFLGPTRTEFPA